MKRRALAILFSVAAACSALFLLGCATTGRLTAVPQEATTKAEIAGMPGVRYVLPEDVPDLLKDAEVALAAELKYRSASGATGPLLPVSFLAVSGGESYQRAERI